MTTKAERFIRDHLGDDAARPPGNPEAADWRHEQMVWTFDDGSTLTVGGEQVTCGRREVPPVARPLLLLLHRRDRRSGAAARRSRLRPRHGRPRPRYAERLNHHGHRHR